MKFSLFTSILTVLFLFTAIPILNAQEKQVLSVTPPLFQVSAIPGNIWQSTIKVVNGNPYSMTVYAEVVNFQAYGENGQGKFTPLIGTEPDASSFASWINISKEPIQIPPEQSVEIPFYIEVPQDAPPGGHYAAVLVSTHAPDSGESKSSLLASQAVSSLFFARIEGDVTELGTIREFRVMDSILPRPEAEFSLRFENKGNVHLQPRGDIVIKNMWGTVRGTIPVNYETHFGNVLPHSIRDFKFSWKSNFTLSDIGRYKAVATVAYGENGNQNVSSMTSFWVIPIRATLITLLILALCISAIVWMVKAYIRRMLTLAGVPVDQDTFEQRSKTTISSREKKQKIEYAVVSAPIRDGVLDLRQRLSTAEEKFDVLTTIVDFILVYKKFFLAILTLIIIFVTVVSYITHATDADREYEVIINPEEGEGR